jgi:parvulin-like peptidyl-prolyl isomerase
MKRIALFLMICLLFITRCSKDRDQSVQLKPGTQAYHLAEELSAQLPYFEPKANNVLVKGRNVKITTGTLIETLHGMFGQQGERLLEMPIDRVRGIVQTHLENLVNETLIINEAMDQGIEVTQADIDSVLEGQYERIGGEEAFADQLKKNDISMDFVTNDIRRKIMINKYFNDQFGEELIPDENDLRELYNQDITATVRHILFLTRGKSDSAKAEIKKKAEEVLALAKSGKDFASLVKQYSEDPGSKDKGGIYEDFKRGDMVPPFEEASFNLPVGAVSDLVETQYGYHIIKVVNRKKETRPFEEIREELVNRFKTDKRKTIYSRHLSELKTTAELEYAPF